MNGFTDPAFWPLCLSGLLGIALWLLGSRLDVKDPRVDGTAWNMLRANRVSIAYAIVAHVIASVALWEGVEMIGLAPARHMGYYIASGCLAQSLVPKILGATLYRFQEKKP